MYYRFWGTTLLILINTMLCSNLIAQKIDTIKLKEYEFVDQRVNTFSSGIKTEVFNNEDLNKQPIANLSELLNKQLPTFIKSYGLGSLATPSFRGTSASHTAILWNGINLQSNMNGQYDFALSPISLSNQVFVQMGGAGALFGSGALGGSIHLNTTPKYNSGLSLSVNNSIGSFKSINEQIGLGFGNEKYYGIIKVLHQKAKNDFPFKNITKFDAPVELLDNAALNHTSISIDQYFRPKNNQQIEAHLWIQNISRQIPASMTMGKSLAKQNDNNIRFSSSYRRYSNNSRQTFRVSYLNENIHYVDSISGIDANNNSESFIAEVENKTKINNQNCINLGINNTFRIANVRAYSKNPKQNNFSVFASYKYISKNEKLHLVSSIRNELVENQILPITPSLGFDYELSKHLSIHSHTSRVYRIPTFNDKYWSPGGNIDLRPETGWSNDLGLNWLMKKGKNEIRVQSNIFNNIIDDWIIWLPTSHAFWSPQNIRKVWSRGIESNANYSFTYKNVTYSIKQVYSYTKSTNEKVSTTNQAILGKQLIYVPYHISKTIVELAYKNFWVSADYNFTDKRFVKSDNSLFVAEYHLFNIAAGQSIKLKQLRFDLILQINNLLNTDYQVIEWRPMPGRNYTINLNLKFNNHKNNSKHERN